MRKSADERNLPITDPAAVRDEPQPEDGPVAEPVPGQGMGQIGIAVIEAHEVNG